MARDLIRSLARAIGGRVRSLLVQAAKSEAARAVRHVRARMQQSPQAAGSAPAAPARVPASASPAPPPDAAVRPTPPAAEPAREPNRRPLPSEEPAREPDRTTPSSEEPAREPEESAGTGAAAPGSRRPAAQQDAPPADGIVNVNAASKDELIALPGIGEARADAIVKGRPFAAADDLVERKILPASVFENLKGRIGVA